MAGRGLSLADIKEIKRLHNLGLSGRKIAKVLGVHRNTVDKYLSQDQDQDHSSAEVVSAATSEPEWVRLVDWEKVRSEYLSGVSLNVIHEELCSSNQVPVKYPGFWKQTSKKISLSEATMVRVFKPGDRAEIDYADGIDILDPATGAIRKTELFVGVLCHSRYAFAEFSFSQSSQDFLTSHVNMFNYFGGVPQVISPDNLKSAVTKAHRYDPTINQAYTRLAEYYNVAVVPARVRTPQDKAIVERTIQIFQRWFYMIIRHRTFTSLLELNQCLKEHLVLFNNRVHRIFKKTRQEMFLNERDHLQTLPESPYKVATYHRAKLSRDCHLVFEKNYYSCPHYLRGQELDLWVTGKTLEIYHQAQRVALHTRRQGQGHFSTDTAHYPPEQQSYAEQDIQKLIDQSKRIGPHTEAFVQRVLSESHPLRHIRRLQGVMALSWKYSAESLELGCLEANRFNHKSIQFIENVIKTRKGVRRSTEGIITTRSYNPHLRGVENIH